MTKIVHVIKQTNKSFKKYAVSKGSKMEYNIDTL